MKMTIYELKRECINCAIKIPYEGIFWKRVLRAYVDME